MSTREDRVAEYMAVLSEAHGLVQQSQLDRAAQTGERALVLARALGEPTFEASALGTLIGVYGLKGDAAKAIETGLTALAIAAAIPDANLCTTIHGDVVRCAAPEVNKLTRQFLALGSGGEFGKALHVGAQVRQLLTRLGDPGRLASLLAAEAELYKAQGRWTESFKSLEHAFEVAMPGGVYDVLRQLIGQLNAGLKEFVAGTLMGALDTDSSFAVRRLESGARTAEAVLTYERSERTALVRSQYEASRTERSLEALDSLLDELSASGDRAGMATAMALKAQLVGAREVMTSAGTTGSLACYTDALNHAVASRNARIVWPIVVELGKTIERARTARLTEEVQRASEAESKLRTCLQEFVGILSQ